MKKGKWTAEEDEKLVSYIRHNGEGSWRSLPKNAGLLRCGKSCRLRWINYLKDDLKRGNISPEEESTIIKLQAELGNRWSLIANSLPGRTDNEIKNHWNSHLSRRIQSEMNKGAPPVKKKRGRKPKPKPTKEESGSGSNLKQMESQSETTKETEVTLTSTSSEGSTDKVLERTCSGEDGLGVIDFDIEDFNLEDLWDDVDNNTNITIDNNNNSSSYNIENDDLWWPPVLPQIASANSLVGLDDTILDQPMSGIESACQWEDDVDFNQWLDTDFGAGALFD